MVLVVSGNCRAWKLFSSTSVCVNLVAGFCLVYLLSTSFSLLVLGLHIHNFYCKFFYFYSTDKNLISGVNMNVVILPSLVQRFYLMVPAKESS
jgi:hypothetical protein